MANYAQLKAAVQSVVKSNGAHEITGANLQTTLLNIINSLGANYTFAGIATPDTDPGSPDANVFYIAPSGTYANFGSSYPVPVGNIGVFVWNGSWGKTSVKIQDFTLGVTYTDSNDANAIIQSAIIRDTTISKIRFTIGTANNLNVLFFDSSDNEVTGRYYTSLSAIEETFTFMSGHTNNIVMFNRGYLRDLVTTNYGKTNYYISGNFTAEAYDEQYFYLYRNVSDKMMTALGYGWTDNPIINNMLPYAVLTTDVKKVRVSMSTLGVNIYLCDSNGSTLRARVIEDVTYFNNDFFEIIVGGASTTLTDGLFILNKTAIDRVRERYVMSDYTVFDGTIINDAVYNYEGKELLFGGERTRDWGTDSLDFDTAGAYIGANIYNTVDCFRFPALITEVTIPSAKDTIVEIYRTRIDDVSGESSAVLLDTVQVKAGKYTYPVNIEMDAGDGFGLACHTSSSIKFYSTPSWRLSSYSIETLLRSSGSTGFAKGCMMFSCKYKYFAKPSVPAKKLAGKTISVIGDSISTFGTEYSYSNPYYPSSTVTNYLRTWWGRLVQDGATIMKNMSVSRSTIADPGGDVAYRWIGYNDRITALGDNGNSPDIIMVLAGINDMFSTSALTDFDFTKNTTNYNELNKSEFSTAYQWIVMKLLELYPTSKIFLCTPFKAGVSNWGFPEKNGSRYFYQLRDSIRTLAETLGVGFIDFYAETKISWSQMNGGAYGDTTHPDANGHYEYYKIARRHLVDFVQNNIYI